MCLLGVMVEYSRMQLPSFSSGCDIAPFFCSLHGEFQTKILEGRTNHSECVFEARFKGVSAPFGLRVLGGVNIAR